MQRFTLIAACSLLPGCGHGVLTALVAILVVVWFAQTLLVGRRCPYCGAAEVTAKLMQPGELHTWKCDDCGEEF
jgi:hypothetical protein